MTLIEWADKTWNPRLSGCTKCSKGCRICYAEIMAKRLQAMGIERQPKYANGFEFTIHDDLKGLEKPLHWKKPQIIFVNSMSDLFHEKAPLEVIQSIFEIMNKANWHFYLILTKRSWRVAELNPFLDWQPHIGLGVTVEHQDYVSRIKDLLEVDAHVRFLSCEPLLSDIDLILDGIDWVIAGGESGSGYRAVKPEWIRKIKNQCKNAHVPFFFKQWGGINKKKAGRMLDGQEYSEYPKQISKWKKVI